MKAVSVTGRESVAPEGRRRLSRLVSLRELAEAWGCDRSTVARRLASARVRPFVFNSSRTGLKRYSLEEVLAYLERCRGREDATLL